MNHMDSSAFFNRESLIAMANDGKCPTDESPATTAASDHACLSNNEDHKNSSLSKASSDCIEVLNDDDGNEDPVSKKDQNEIAIAIPAAASPQCISPWEEPTYSSGEFAFACITFMLIGMTNFFGYSIVLNAGGAIKDYIFPDAAGLENRLFAFLVSADFLSTAALSILGSLNKQLIFVGLGLMGVGTLGMLVCVLTVQGSIGAALVQFFVIAIGAGSSVSCNSVLCLANELHNPTFPGVVSTGGGAAGICSFILWMILSEAVFGHSIEGIKQSLGVILSLGSVGPIFIIVMLYMFLRRPWVQQYLRMHDRATITHDVEKQSAHVDRDITNSTRLPIGAKRVSDVETATDLRTVGQARASRTESRFSSVSRAATKRLKANLADAWRVLKACYPAALGVFTILFLCYGVVPVVGPLHWKHLTNIQKDLIVVGSVWLCASLHIISPQGMFQMGDVLGRYTPVLIASLRPNMGVVWKLIAIVLCFDTIVVVTAHYPDVPVITHFGFRVPLILALALIMGFVSTLAIIKAPSFLPLHDPLGRSKASSMAILGLLAGASIGQWVSNLLVL